MIPALDGFAAIVTAVSLAFAAAMAAAIIAFLLRRRRREQGARDHNQEKIAASRALMRALASADLKVHDTELPAGAWRAALSHLLRLVRGEDRVRLLAIAEGRGLFADALAELRDRCQARRIDAMRLLKQFASLECIAGLNNCMLADPVLAVRLEAAAALARIGALPRVLELVAALRMAQQPVTRLHAALFRSLAQRDAEQLAELAASARYGASRPLLIEAMGWTADLAMLLQLVGHASNADQEVRCAAIRAARSLGHPGVGQWIVPMLDDAAERCGFKLPKRAGSSASKAQSPCLSVLPRNPHGGCARGLGPRSNCCGSAAARRLAWRVPHRDERLREAAVAAAIAHLPPPVEPRAMERNIR